MFSATTTKQRRDRLGKTSWKINLEAQESMLGTKDLSAIQSSKDCEYRGAMGAGDGVLTGAGDLEDASILGLCHFKVVYHVVSCLVCI